MSAGLKEGDKTRSTMTAWGVGGGEGGRRARWFTLLELDAAAAVVVVVGLVFFFFFFF